MDTRTSPIRMRLAQLREELARCGIDALLVPSSDPHLSEYLPERWQGREWLSGFTGSMGTLVVGSRARRALRRQPLLGAGRGRAGRQRHRAGEDPHRHVATRTSTGWSSRCRAAAVSRSTARCSAWPRRSAARRGSTPPASTLRTDARPARRRLARPPRPARRSRSTSTARRTHRAARAAKLAQVREAMAAARRDAPLRLDRRRHRLADQPARRRRRATTRCSWPTC